MIMPWHWQPALLSMATLLLAATALSELSAFVPSKSQPPMKSRQEEGTSVAAYGSRKGMSVHEQHDKPLDNLSSENIREVLLEILNTVQDPAEMTALLFGFVSKLASFDESAIRSISTLFPNLIGAISRLENSVSLLLLLLTIVKPRVHDDIRLRILEAVSREPVSVAALLDVLRRADTADIVLDLLQNRETLIEDFVRMAVRQEDPAVLKNVCAVLPGLEAMWFLNYNQLLPLFENEYYGLRCALLEILGNLIIYFKEQGNIEAIRELTGQVEARLRDVNFYVRNKSLSVISDLFRKESILKDQRNTIIASITERTRDKTVIVRRKAVSIMSQVLLNHPFKHRKFLFREPRSCDGPSDTIPVLDSEKENLNGDISRGQSKQTGGRMEEDFEEFIELAENALAAISSLLEYDLKTDLVEISEFMKIAYLLKVEGAADAVRKLLGLVFTKDREVVTSLFSEIFLHRPEIIYEFIGDKAFDELLTQLNVDQSSLYKHFYGNVRPLENIYVLSHLGGTLSGPNALTLLLHCTETLFRSRDEEELKTNIQIYSHGLRVLRKLRSRIPYNHDILRTANKNVVKMIFFERSIIKLTIELFYAVSQDPGKNSAKLLKNLALAKSTIKILDSLGWIALNAFYLLERLEHTFKAQSIQTGGASDGLKTIRKSLGEDELTEIRDRRQSLEESRRASLGRGRESLRMSLRLEEFHELVQNKNEEEVADIFFFLKEKELLYSTSSMLSQFILLLKTSVHSSNESIQRVAFETMGRCMLISSQFYQENLPLFLSSLNHSSSSIRNSTVIILHDFAIYYNASFDISILFDCLNDPSIRKNTLLVLYSLLIRNIIRIRGKSMKVVRHIQDDESGPVVRYLLKGVSGNNNIMSLIFYEAFTGDAPEEVLEYLCSLLNKNIHEALFMRCLVSEQPIDRIRCIFHGLEISDKFIGDNMHREKLKLIISKDG